MSFFRCYALNQFGRFITGTDIEADTTEGAIQAGWDFVAAQFAEEQAIGLEIWQGRTLLFSTDPKFAARGMSTSPLPRDYVENRSE